MHLARFIVISALVAVGVVSGCQGGGSSNSGGGGAGTIAIDAGNNQTAQTGMALPNPLVVLVSGPSGAAAPNVAVVFAVTSGGGALLTTSTTTNAGGLAQTSYTLGSVIGPNTITATASGFTGSPITFTEMATGPPALITATGGNAQQQAAGTLLATALSATVTDIQGNPVGQVTVNFVPTGLGTVAAPSTVTNASGVVTMPYTLDVTPGVPPVTNLITASVAGVASNAVFSEAGISLFGAPASTATGGSSPTSIAVADVTSKGVASLIVGNTGTSPSTVSILVNDGTGNFTGFAGSPLAMAVGAAPAAAGGIATGDINNDGHVDFVIVDTANDAVDVYLNSAANPGAFAAPTVVTTAMGTFNGATVCALADVNNDGVLDLIVLNAGNGTVSILLGQGIPLMGNGTFAAMAGSPFPIAGAPATLKAMAVGDVNKDGVPDILVTDSGGGQVFALLSGGGTFTLAANPFSTGVGSSPFGIALSDVNNDGNLSIVTANNMSNSVSVLLGTGTGIFVPATNSPFGLAAGSGPTGIAVGNIAGTGNPMIVVANTTAGTVSALYGDGTGNFTPATGAGGGGPFPAGSAPLGIVIADFNNSNKLSVVVSNNSVPGNISLLLRN